MERDHDATKARILGHPRPSRIGPDGNLNPAYRGCPDCERWFAAYSRGDGWALLGMPPKDPHR